MFGSTLAEQYDAAVNEFKQLEESSNTTNYTEKVKKTAEKLLEIQHKVHQLSLFSINESLEDVATTDLKYMKLLALIGLVYLKIYDQKTRSDILKEGKRYLQLFLDFMDLYGFDLSNEKPNRETKIQDFKKKRELKSKFEVLNTNEEEQLREYYIVELELLILEVKEEFWNIHMELEMLNFKIEQDERMKYKLQDEERVETRNVPSERPGALLSQKGKVLQPFVITTERAKREELLNGVFKPGHTLPSMSIEEYLDREMERGNMLSGGAYIIIHVGKRPKKTKSMI
jgi:immunoglobulin-binding protein 1